MLSYSGFEIRQDSLLRPTPQQGRPFRLNVPVEKLQIDQDRAQEIIEQVEQREQQIVAEQQTRVIRPRIETLRKPSIEIDSLIAKYRHIGCSPRSDFPDTLSLTILERWYQPITFAFEPDSLSIDTAGFATFAENIDTATLTSPADSLSAAVPVVTVAPPAAPAGFPSEVRTDVYPSVITFFIVCGLILLTSIKFRFGDNLSQAFISVFSYRQARRMYEERRESDRQAALSSNILFALVVGIYVSVALPFFGGGPLWGNYALSVLFFSLFAGLLYLVKAGVWKMLGVVFMTQSLSKTYIYNMFLYNRNIGIFIFPLVAGIPFVAYEIVPYAIYGVIAIFGMSYLLRIRRIFQIIHAQNVPLYYFILYLCTLEILPLLLFVKVCKVLNDYLVM